MPCFRFSFCFMYFETFSEMSPRPSKLPKRPVSRATSANVGRDSSNVLSRLASTTRPAIDASAVAPNIAGMTTFHRAASLRMRQPLREDGAER